jgi:hypothetical protein
MFIIGLGFLAIGYAIAYHGINVLMWAHGPGDASKQDPVPFHLLLGFPAGTGAVHPGFLPLINLEGVKAGQGATALGGGPAAPPAGQTQGSAGPPAPGGAANPGQLEAT